MSKKGKSPKKSPKPVKKPKKSKKPSYEKEALVKVNGIVEDWFDGRRSMVDALRDIQQVLREVDLPVATKITLEIGTDEVVAHPVPQP